MSLTTIHYLLCTLVFLAIQAPAISQVAGKRSFEFLNVPYSARLAGMGGVNISLADKDVNFFTSNPALVGDTLAGFASANYQFYVADIGHAGFTYANNFKRIGLIIIGIQHLNYGSIQGFDQNGRETGEFKAQDNAIFISKSHQIGNYRFGVTLKGIFSGIAGYNATAIAMDAGGIFKHPHQQLTVGLTLKNIGVVIADYSDSGKSKLPFDVQVGTTFKPEHMPLRFSITAYNLGQKNVVYNVNADEKPSALEKVFSYINFGSEILLHKNVNVLVGYNYLNHQALKLENAGGGAGLSFGFSANIKTFDFVFSRMAYMAGNAAYSFTLSSNIHKLLKRQK
jgi:hypothetical protein